MNPARRNLSLSLGLGLLAFSALLFCTPLEDAYTLPQSAGLALAALCLCLGSGAARFPATPVFLLGLALFVWRAFCHLASTDAPREAPFFALLLTQAAVFLAAASALREDGLRRRAAAALVAAAALGSAFALLAPLGLDPFTAGAVDLGFGRRAHGSLGNPDFLGGWLAMLAPLACVAAARARGAARPWAWACVAVLAAALAATLARAAWLAAAVGVATAAALAGRAVFTRPVWAGLAGVAAAAAGVGLLVGASGQGGRLREAADPHSEAWGSRVFMASVALDLAREKPFTGVGGGAFESEYLRRQGERLQTERGQPYRLTADAHNDWLQTAAETGFPGLVLWAALFALAVRAAWVQGGAEGAVVAGALVAFGVQGCFHFPWDIVPTAGLALLALAAAAGFRARATVAGPRGWSVAAVLVLGGCLAFQLRQCAASALLNSGTTVQADASTRALAEPFLRGSVAINASDERAWDRLGGVQLDRRDLAGALDSFNRSLQILPSSYQAWTNFGLTLGEKGRLTDSATAFQQAVGLNPRSNEAWSDEAKSLYQLGKADAALAAAREGLRQAGGSPQAWFNLGGILFNEGRPAEAAPAFAEVLRLQPDYPQARELLQRCGRARP